MKVWLPVVLAELDFLVDKRFLAIFARVDSKQIWSGWIGVLMVRVTV